MDAGGKSKRDLVRAGALAAAVMVVAPGFGVAQQPSRIAPTPAKVVAIPHGATPAPGDPRVARTPRDRPRAVELSGGPLPEVRGGQPASRGVEKNDGEADRSTSQVDVALQPTWDRGFWALPPGGLTRYLLLPPEVIDVEEVVAWLPRSP